MPARSEWKTPLLAVLALFVGWQAQAALAGPRPLDGLTLYAAAMILYASLLGGQPLVNSVAAIEHLEEPVPALSPRPRAFRVLVSLAILSAAAGLVAFWLPGHDDWGWTLHLTSLLLLLATAVRLRGITAGLRPWRKHRFGRLTKHAEPVEARVEVAAPSTPSARGGAASSGCFSPIFKAQWNRHAFGHAIQRRAGEWALLILILLFALAVRVWQNDSIPPGLYFDEAREGVVARRILAEPAYRPVYIDYIERPAHHAYLIALSFVMFGASIASLRFVPAVFGVLNVLAAYLLFNRVFRSETHAGLIAAALLAVTRYDVTFSRIVFDADSTPFFMMLTLFFLHRGLTGVRVAGPHPVSALQRARQEAGHRAMPAAPPWARQEAVSQRQSDFILAGLTLGVGQGFYLPMRIFALLLFALGFCLVAQTAWRERSVAFLKAWTPHVLLALLAMLLAIAPIVEYALRAPQTFFDRNVTASIFYQRAEPDLLVALYNSTVKHLGMFNYQGDQNARHNLPGEPMLDPLSGVLFLLGIGLAVRRWRDGPNFVMLVLFAGMLQAGILSTDWEAPQALRSVGVLPSVIYFMTLALVAPAAALSRLSDGLFAGRLGRDSPSRPLPSAQLDHARRLPLLARFAPSLLFAGIFVVIAWLNLDLYFNHQAHDTAVWRAHSPVEVWAAGEMKRLAPTHDIILAARYEASPTIMFLAPGIAPARTITATDQIPLSPVPVRPVVMFLDSTLQGKLDDVRRVYPSAEIRELRPPDNAEPAAYEIILDFPQHD